MVGWCTVVDPDAADAVDGAFTFTRSTTDAQTPNAEALFVIGPKTGRVSLRTSGSLNFESAGTNGIFPLTIKVTDSAGNTHTQTQKIYVKDVNDCLLYTSPSPRD